MKHKIATRMASFAPFHVMELLGRARELESQGKSIIHMEIGEPDFSTPQTIVDAGITALKNNQTKYTPSLGLPQLREVLAEFYQHYFCAPISPHNIAITPGSSGALLIACGVLVNPGDEVLLTDPGYPCNKQFVQLMGGVPRFINLSEKNQYQIELEQIKSHWNEKTRCIFLASPSNPTGSVIPQEILAEIAKFAESNNGYVILDEIYLGLSYQSEIKSFAGKFDNVFIVSSFSKFFCMTGWRVGWLIAPTEFMSSVDKMAQNVFLAASTPSQYAALAAFQPDTLVTLEQYRDEFKKRRDYLSQAVQQLGFDLSEVPQGAFYLYLNSKKFSEDSSELAESLLENAGVAITPGKDFGVNNTESHIRIAYTTSQKNLEIGIQRIADYLA